MASPSLKALSTLKTTSRICLAGYLAWVFLLISGETAAAEGQLVDGVYLKATVRTPVQMTAFYEARGFPARATAILGKYCFVTVIVRNRSDRVVWLEPGRWTIKAEDGHVTAPMTPAAWSKEWNDVVLPAAQRATFQWTQLPKSRDLQPHEPVGGNLAFHGFTGKFALKMQFATGAMRDGRPIRAEFRGLSCGKDPEPQN